MRKYVNADGGLQPGLGLSRNQETKNDGRSLLALYVRRVDRLKTISEFHGPRVISNSPAGLQACLPLPSTPHPALKKMHSAYFRGAGHSGHVYLQSTAAEASHFKKYRFKSIAV